MSKKAPNCKFCGNPADLMDNREVDGIVSKIPSCKVCQGFANSFLYANQEEKIKLLTRQVEWFNNFADAVMGDRSTYESACEYADEQEVEKYGHNYVGDYSSVHDFIDEFGLHDEADELFGEGWEAENDIEQIQELVGDEYIVKAIEPKTKREKRVDNYIQVIWAGKI